MRVFVLFELPTLILLFGQVFLSAVLTDRCVVVFLLLFLLFLLLFLIRLLSWLLPLVLDEGHHLFHRFGGALDECLHLLRVLFSEGCNQFFRHLGLLLDHVCFEVLRGEFVLFILFRLLC
jgi:hypothetical protein